MANDIREWLEGLGLGRYAEAFAENEIELRSLPYLDQDDLKELGVALGHRKLMLAAIAELLPALSLDSADQHRVSAATGSTKAGGAERRQLTVMFCDLVGSTELSHRLDPEELRDIMRRYQDAVAGSITRYEGYVAKYLGDGVLAYFGWPQAYEDQAERAVRAGLDAVAAMAGVRLEPGDALQARVGIATGQVVIGDIFGEKSAQTEAVIGETPNLAARLQGLAAPGQVVIGTTTRRLIGETFDLENLGAHDLKGFSEPVPAWHVLRESGAESRFEALHGQQVTPLVGRKHEIELVLDRWDRIKAGEGQVVLLAGEPGIGKSRVVRALREELADESFTPLSLYCSPHHTNSALFPVIRQLERAAGFKRDDPPERKLDKLAALLSRGTERLADAMPLITKLLGISTGDRFPHLALSPQKQKQLTLEVLAEQIEGLAARQPVLAVYEDVHWIDPTTLEMLGLLIERVQHRPVLILVTYRPEFNPPWTSHTHVTQLSLARLTRPHGSEIVERLTGGKALPAELFQQILDKADGVPLFAEELTKNVLESGLLRDVGDRFEVAGSSSNFEIPATLHDSLIARLDRLALAKEVAQIGATIGREFTYELLAAVSPQSENTLDRTLDQLVASELVFRRGSPPDASYSFKHALVRDAAYQSMLKPRRHELHAAIAQAIEKRFPEIAVATPEVLAHHCTEAGNAIVAIPYWIEAGRIAVSRSTHSEAIAHLSRGLELLEQVSDPMERARLEISLQMTRGVAMYASRGPVEEVGQIYVRAQHLCQQVNDEEQLYVALWGHWLVESQRMNFEISRGLAEDLLKLADRQANEDLTLQAYHASWTTAFYEGELRQCKAQAEQGIALYDAERHHHQVALYGAHDAGVCCRCHASLTLWLLGDPDAAAHRAEEALALADSLGHPFSLCQALLLSSVIRQFRGDVTGVRELSERLVATAGERGVAVFGASGAVLLGWSIAAQGDTGEGLTVIEAALKTLREMDADLRRSYFLWLLADTYARAGDHTRGLEAITEALAFVAERGEHWWEPEIHRLHGELLLMTSAEDHVDAEAAFGRAVEIARQQSAKSPEMRATMSLARLWADQGKRQVAHDLLAPVYNRSTEGFDTPDLREAKALLGELA